MLIDISKFFPIQFCRTAQARGEKVLATPAQIFGANTVVSGSGANLKIEIFWDDAKLSLIAESPMPSPSSGEDWLAAIAFNAFDKLSLLSESTSKASARLDLPSLTTWNGSSSRSTGVSLSFYTSDTGANRPKASEL